MLLTDRLGPALRSLAVRARYAQRKRSGWTGLNGLDKRLVALLPDGPGFFVEAGANDGVKQSNTYYLEKRRGWTGLLVEPVPRLARDCRRNRTATVVNAALVAPEMEGATVDLVDVGLMTIVPGAQGSDAADESYVSAGERAQGVQRQKVTTPGRTLSSILAEIGDPLVDLLSLDVEGYEVEALRGLDLDRHAPRRILVETFNIDQVMGLLADRYDTQCRLSAHDWLLVLR